MERRSPELLDRLAIRAAYLHHSDRKSVREVTAELQAAGEPVRKDDDIRMLIRRALTTGLVKIEVTRTLSTGTLDLDTRLGRRLAERFGMRNVYVVTDRALAGLKDQDPLAYGDQIHLGLGWAAAGFLMSRIRDRDTIAVGGGRALGFTVDALKELQKDTRQSFKDLSILSLVGNNIIRRQDLRKLGDGNLTADTVAFDLAVILGVDFEKVRFVHLPLSLPDSLNEDVASEVMKVLGGHLLNWQSPPDVAVFSMGTVNHRHYMVNQRGPETEPVRGELDTLMREILPQAPDSIAKICYKLFWVGDRSSPSELRERASALMDAFNKKTVSVPLNLLNQAREKVLVAGGPEMVNAIRAVARASAEAASGGSPVDYDGVVPTCLVTDAVTADALDTMPS